MTDRADAMIQALRSAHDDLAGLVHGFTSEDLARPAPASSDVGRRPIGPKSDARPTRGPLAPPARARRLGAV